MISDRHQGLGSYLFSLLQSPCSNLVSHSLPLASSINLLLAFRKRCFHLKSFVVVTENIQSDRVPYFLGRNYD